MVLKSLLTSLLLITAFFILPLRIWAASPSSILVNVSPDNPAPYANTTISLSSYESNLDSVTISWFVNGRNAASGIGKKSFSLTAGASGVSTDVIAKVFLPDGEVDTRITIRPSVMVLLWEATDSYVPPFYKGKALPVADSEIKVVALPEIKSGSGFVSAKNMTYAWKKDYSNDQGASGYGKNFYIYDNDYLENSNDVSVVAATIDQNSSVESSINVATYLPKISFYKKDPAMGTLWEQTLENGHQINGDEVVVAEPYFIAPKDIRNPMLSFDWLINGSTVSSNSSQKNVIPLKVEAGVTGRANLELEIENSQKIFQTANKEISVQF